MHEIWVRPEQDLRSQSRLRDPPPLFSNQVVDFLSFILIAHTSSFSLITCLLPLPVSVVLSVWAWLPADNGNSSDRLDFPWGYTKLDSRTYRGPEGKPANYSSTLCHTGSSCLSPSICGQRESADRPACFYLPSVSIQDDEACQGFTGTGNVSLAPGVSVV